MLDIDLCSCELIRWLHRDAENIGHLFEKRPKVGSLFMVAALRGVRQIASRNFMSMLTMSMLSTSILTEKSGRDRQLNIFGTIQDQSSQAITALMSVSKRV